MVLDERANARVIEFLAARPDGVDPETLGREVLALTGPSALIARVSSGVAATIAGVVQDGDGLLRLALDAPAHVAVVVRTVGLGDSADAALELAVATIGEGGPGAIWEAVVAPPRPLPEDVLVAFAFDPRRLLGAITRAEAAAELANRLEDARVVLWDRPSAQAIASVLAGRPPSAPSRARAPARELVLLRPRLEARMRLRGATLRDAAAALDLPVPLTREVATSARTLTLAWEVMCERGWEKAPPPPAPFDWGRTSLSPARLAALPEGPGIYRLLRRDGRPLYVGKAKCLRARVATYFEGTDRRRLHGELMAEVFDVEIEETGSELMALLREAEEIARLSPPYNVARRVERGSNRRGRKAILLPSAEGGVTVLLVRDATLVAMADASEGDALRRGIVALDDPAASLDDPSSRIAATWLDRDVDGLGSAVVTLDDADDAATMLQCIMEAMADPELFLGRFARI